MKSIALVVCLGLLTGIVVAGNKPRPKICVRLDQSVTEVVADHLEEFDEALMRPLAKHGLDVSMCPAEDQPMELHYSVSVQHVGEKADYRTEQMPDGSAVTTPEVRRAWSYGAWHLLFYGGQVMGNAEWQGLDVDEGSVTVAKWIVKHGKKMR